MRVCGITLLCCAFLALAAAADRRLANIRIMRSGVTPSAAASSTTRRCSASPPLGTSPAPLLLDRLLQQTQLFFNTVLLIFCFSGRSGGVRELLAHKCVLVDWKQSPANLKSDVPP